VKSIRKFVYAATLILSALNLAPTLASAQDASGTFILTHDVRWQNATVPAGKYEFTLETKGPSEVLTLSNVSFGGAGFVLLVSDAEKVAKLAESRLVLISRNGKSFVSAMELVEVGMTLHFAMPAESPAVAPTAMVQSASAAH
jgi:hypothetical protein